MASFCHLRKRKGEEGRERERGRRKVKCILRHSEGEGNCLDPVQVGRAVCLQFWQGRNTLNLANVNLTGNPRKTCYITQVYESQYKKNGTQSCGK